jgi:hypothetical protein
MEHQAIRQTLDITPPFRKARELGRVRADEFAPLLHALRGRLSEATVSWDSGVPENWASVKLASNPGGIISARFPLALVAAHSLEQIGLVLAPDWVLVVVDDMMTRCYSIDPAELSRWFPSGWAGAATGAFSPEEFSIDEIWWATITA